MVSPIRLPSSYISNRLFRRQGGALESIGIISDKSRVVIKAMITSTRQQLAGLFRTFLEYESVVDQSTSLAAYECDGLSAYRQTPLMVVLPKTIEEVQKIQQLVPALSSVVSENTDDHA